MKLFRFLMNVLGGVRQVVERFGPMLLLAGAVGVVDASEENITSAIREIAAPGGQVLVESYSVGDEEGAGRCSECIGLRLKFKNGQSGEVTTISYLPYLADTGSVHAAFFLDPFEACKNKLVVVHGVEIRSDTGVPYYGDYYSVHVFDVLAGNYKRNERQSGYFGYGADVVAYHEDENYMEYLFSYPYKTEKDIRLEMSSDHYSRWLSGNNDVVIADKRVRLYSGNSIVDTTDEFIGVDQAIRPVDEGGGWMKVVSKDAQGKDVTGWIIRKDIQHLIR
jgi:hypothetical protein